MIAGYPWFTDWGRDTMISLPGLLIARGRLQEAREVLRGFLAHIDRGLIPNAFPRIGLYVSLAVLYYQIGLIDTYWGIVFLHMIGTMVYMTWITTATFRSIDPHLEEAARDAGASPLRAFLSVVLPLALPGIIVASLFSFLASLDEAQGTLIVGTPHYITMPVLLYTLISSFQRPVAAVFSVLLALPSLLLLIVAQRYLHSEYVAAGLGRV